MMLRRRQARMWRSRFHFWAPGGRGPETEDTRDGRQTGRQTGRPADRSSWGDSSSQWALLPVSQPISLTRPEPRIEPPACNCAEGQGGPENGLISRGGRGRGRADDEGEGKGKDAAELSMTERKREMLKDIGNTREREGERAPVTSWETADCRCTQQPEGSRHSNG